MFTLSGRGSRISCEVFPPYDVSVGEWEIGLIGLSTFNSIPNIEREINDKLYYGERVLAISEGSYEIEDLERYITENVTDGVVFTLRANNNTLKAEIRCSERLDFTKEHTIGPLLGFSKASLGPNIIHESDNPVNIIKVNTIRVECNIARGSFENGKEGHVLHEFYPTAAPGYKIVETPAPIIYLPVSVRTIDTITVLLKDQNGELINFRDEVVSLRLHVRRKHGSGI